jgi:uncharacterized membrane protein
MAERDAERDARIAALEARVAELSAAVARLQGGTPRARETAPAPAPPPALAPALAPVPLLDQATEPAPPPAAASRVLAPAPEPLPAPASAPSEDWITRIGIALLLLGCAFLFKYSIDKGWLVPAARVGIGIAVGVALLAVGWRTRRERPTYGELLLGGGIAALHVALFASYFLYELTSYSVTFGSMAAVNVLAFGLAWRIDRSSLSVLGAIGAYATPFVLPGGSAGAPALFTYLAVVMAGTGAVVAVKRWGVLLFTSFVGAWSVLGLAVLPTRLTGAGAWVAQAAVAVAWFSFTAVPSLRLAQRTRERDGHAPPELAAVQGAVLLGPLLALPLTRAIWDWGDRTQGLVAFAFAGAITAFGVVHPRPWGREVARGHYLAALSLATVGLLLVFEGDVLYGALIAEVIALHWLGARRDGDPFAAFGHLVAVAVWFWTGARLAEPPPGGPVLLDALLGLAAAVSMGVGAVRVRHEGVRLIYAVACHAALLVWWRWLLLAGEAGQAYVSIAWGAQSIAMLAIGVVRRLDEVRWLGLATLGIVVGKLLFVDLAEVAAHWRILLFMGFGGVLLALGYYLPRLARPR